MIDDTVLAAIPRPIDVGPEHDALRRFHRDGTWEGRIQPEGMGPGTPAQMAYGSAKQSGSRKDAGSSASTPRINT
jgi:hypothetical protein